MAENVDRREFLNLLRVEILYIVNYIADLEGSTDRDYSNYCIFSFLYFTRFIIVSTRFSRFKTILSKFLPFVI